MPRFQERQRNRLIVTITGASVFLIAALAAVDKFFGVPFFDDWGGATSMAVPTIACFFLLGSALMLLGRPPEK